MCAVVLLVCGCGLYGPFTCDHCDERVEVWHLRDRGDTPSWQIVSPSPYCPLCGDANP